MITVMTPIEQRNELLAQRMIKSLNRRNMDAFYCPTSAGAIAKVMELMPQGSTVSWGGSMTLRDMGLTRALHDDGRYILLDRDRAVDRAEAVEIYLQAFRADYYLSSANAITEDGVIVNIDGNGNRVAAITFGPSHVIFVIGLNKVTQTVDAALARARSTAGPINTARFDISTPCKADGVCHNCNSPECICNHIHFLRNSPRRRHTVVLVGEPLGY
ncbi:lactate utilization protein [Xylanibacter rodentium]|mgnify:CR=1 FL=1|jgi:L-lactate utilization protein LutC|nr:lactate utilization protein [Xylanibacter rodentium]